ncbi:MAG: c-type cytochrome [Acidimicrobiales bacterium]
MTEIPEHLLKRSKERRAAIGGEEAPASEAPAGEAVEATPAAPEPVAAAVAATPEPAPVPEPMRPEVAAAHARKKIPFWALPVLVFLPLWAYVYQATLEPAPSGELTPVEQGGLVYHECAACHGAGGAGSASVPALDGVLETWPDYRDHMLWVKLGSTGWSTYADTYGAPKKPVKGGMPAHASMSDEDLALVVLYERVSFGGLTEDDEEYALLLDIADGKTTFADAGLGDVAAAAGIPEDALAAG